MKQMSPALHAAHLSKATVGKLPKALKQVLYDMWHVATEITYNSATTVRVEAASEPPLRSKLHVYSL